MEIKYALRTDFMSNETAFIFAAGKGERLRPITCTTPKPLVKVNGISMIDTVIRGLQLRKVKEIYVVVGYLKEKFVDLPEKYENVKLVENTECTFKNNISSIHAILDYLGKDDCFICDADLVVQDPTIFLKDFDRSCGFGKFVEGHTDEWVYEMNDDRVVRIGPGGENAHTMGGISYFRKEDAQTLADAVREVYRHEGHEQLFWDNILDQQLGNINLTVNPITEEQVVEIDSVSELQAMDPSYADVLV